MTELRQRGPDEHHEPIEDVIRRARDAEWSWARYGLPTWQFVSTLERRRDAGETHVIRF